ncbi:carbonic anhydrase [Methanothermobacter sp. CaT2]|uniref:Carbonic anhydrase n=2 Tax=Methanothermobacter TaxID=145260 RepID=A0A371NBN3_9EURY|nr:MULTISPECIES: carbonic anhydrase [Methanothermobacter]NLU04394.1 carbonic anhydrase [Methanothermobacter sp.]AAC44822.1 orf3; similar to the carbonic anhydrase from Synechococcus PCC7942 (GenBank Accession Number M77095) [Methanothermobacter thermautotrophicus]REE26368.1 carbonic anhydrase [Methanothermobacter defluvii]WBF07863.1 carbonic anhydrase [Methanothermobacter thermautotrophicus]BAM70685.1 carbonic anhydrase [Methanothermobacter sp. CaT2]
MILDDVLIKNQEFVKNFHAEKLSHKPKKKLAIVTCMDTRLAGFLESAMGLERGDAKIIKNAGNRITEDALRSLVVAIYSLGAEEVMVVGHTDCGMANVNFDKIRESMKTMGISEDVIEKLNLEEWIGAIDDEEKNVIEGVKKIKNAEFIPEIPVHGLIVDINSGAIKVLHNDS